MSQKSIFVKGARENNLKNIDVSIPRDKLVVVTGLSGSGKSSLAFDTIYAEGQRRYVESLSAYARQFLGRMEKPDVDYIEGLSPAISIDQKGTRHNPRSTVGTVTEIYDYVRLLYARAGRPHCPNCGRLISRQTVQQIVDSILTIPLDTRIMIMAPIVSSRKGEHQGVFDEARKSGFVRVRVNGSIRDLSEEFDLDKKKKHTIEVVVDRMVVGESEGEASRIADSVETALKLSKGVVLVSILEGEESLYSEHFACVHCGISLGEIEPRTFSFNSPHGACSTCTGLGAKLEVDPELVVPNKNLSLSEGALQPWARSGSMNSWYSSMIESVAKEYGFSTHMPVKDLNPEDLRIVLFGTKRNPMTMSHKDRKGKVWEWRTTFEGVVSNLQRRFSETESDWARGEIEKYMTSRPCASCSGDRLKPASLAVTVGGINIMGFTGKSIAEALTWINDLQSLEAPLNNVNEPLTERELTIADQILKEISTRLTFLRDIGLDYITLDRSAGTLSGGEAQRIRLATQIGSGLMGVLYVCDEPSVGLHPADDHRLIATLKRLRDVGNTVLIVEHDEAIMRSADHIVDLGPGAGEHGGQVVAQGSLDDIIACKTSLTGQYLGGFKKIPLPSERRVQDGRSLVIKGARENNLKGIDVVFPLGIFVCVTGVSGSGKSTLINEILFKKLAQKFYRSRDRPGDCDEILGVEHIDKIINIDQSAIGRTPRSNPATYTGAFTPIRELFATMPEARARGYKPGRFSFNVKGGRCEACQGEGYNQIEMQFLPDVTVRCDICNGTRYGREALEIELKGMTISQVLDMTVSQACEFFEHFPRISSKLNTMRDVGLGYIKLGQPATTLSGGEAQRVKLSTELSRRATGRTIYILDEPTTGLSFEDANALLKVLQRLVDTGNTVILIEHHLDLIKSADHIIDLGPKAGDEGGYIVATGTPEEISRVDASYTGRYLKPILEEKITNKVRST